MRHTTSDNAPISVVDDEECVRRSLERLLRAAGYRVLTHASGSDFLQSVKDCPPVCVLLDLHMPVVSGYDVLVALANEAERVPVIVVTAHHNAQTLERAMSAGAVACLSKPVHEDELLAAINSALRR